MQIGPAGKNEADNCTPPAIKEFPSDGLTRQQRQSGFIAIHFVIAIYMFLLLAIVCDDYFVPAIKKICERKFEQFSFSFRKKGKLSRFNYSFPLVVIELRIFGKSKIAEISNICRSIYDNTIIDETNFYSSFVEKLLLIIDYFN